jgi:arylmalonate decarboxylase
LIVPPVAGVVPAEGPALYGHRSDVRFIARGLGLDAVSPEGFDKVADRIVALAVELRDAGADAVSMMGTSLSFYRGADFTDDLRARMQAATGLPCTTMSHAIVASMRQLGIERVAVATSYIDTLNERLVAYLKSRGIAVTAIEGLSMTGVEAMGQVTPQTLQALAMKTVAASTGAEGVLISCGGLHTLSIHVPLEAALGIPVTASSPAGFWDLMMLAGLDPASPGHGRLFESGRVVERTA